MRLLYASTSGIKWQLYVTSCCTFLSRDDVVSLNTKWRGVVPLYFLD